MNKENNDNKEKDERSSDNPTKNRYKVEILILKLDGKNHNRGHIDTGKS